MAKLKTTEEFIKDAIKIHNEKYDYSLVKYTGNKKNIIIYCHLHGEFKQYPQNHLSGQGCPKCYGTSLKTTEEFIKDAIKIHNEKYNYSLVRYKGAFKKVIIVCFLHGEFIQKPNDHLSGVGCPNCANKNVTTVKFIEKSKLIHNNRYDYSLVNYKNSYTKVKILCSIHGEFKQKPNNHLDGNGCPKCGGTRKLTLKEFIEKSKLIHGNKYDYSLVNYKNNITKVKIICNDHGLFEQTPGHHMNNIGCPICKESKGEKEIRIFLNNYHINYDYQKTFKGCKYIRLLPFDFYLPDYNICIEYDGEQHYEEKHYFNFKNNYKNQIKKDIIKTKYCKDNSINLIRIKYTDKIDDILINKFKILKVIS